MIRLAVFSYALVALSAVSCAQRPLPSENSEAARAPVVPERVGVRSGPLADMIAYARESGANVHNVTLLRHGRTVLDVDFYPYSGDVPHDIASVTKSVTATLVGLAVAEGHIPSRDAPVASFFPEVVPADDRWQSVTVRQFLTMTSGLCAPFAEDGIADGERQLDAMRQTDDWAAFMFGQPFVAEPGGAFAYCSGTSHLLSALLARATGRTAEEYARERLFGPLGVTDYRWPTDPQGNPTGWGDLFLRPDDLAKIGLLYLRDGVWDGERLLPEGWVAEATRAHVETGTGEGYGYRWWVSRELPGLYEGVGRGGQRLSVWPGGDAVVVMLGSGFEPGDLGRFVVEAITDEARLPENPTAVGRLQAEIEAAGEPPPPRPVPPFPATARAVSGQLYTLEPNDIGLTGFRLDFPPPGGDEAVFTLSLDVRRSQEFGDRVSPVGLDGRYRISPSSRFGLPLAARGRWEDDQTFRLDYNEPANNHFWRFVFRFEGERAAVGLQERSGMYDLTLEATSADP